jgi:gamma-glutamyltranspeptidase/glutathione hydrolase
VREQALTSGLQALQIQADGIQGGADPRREGIVLGD